jgi:hypothetical protein
MNWLNLQLLKRDMIQMGVLTLQTCCRQDVICPIWAQNILWMCFILAPNEKIVSYSFLKSVQKHARQKNYGTNMN